MPISINEVSSTSIPSATPANPNFSGLTGRNDVVQKLAAYKQVNNSANRLQFPSDLGKYYMKIQIADYHRASAFKLNFTPTDTIILPMASQLSDTNIVKYDEGSLGPLGGQIADAVVSSYNAIGKSMSSTQLTLGEFKTVISSALTEGALQHAAGIGGAAVLEGVRDSANLINKLGRKLGFGKNVLPIDEVIGFVGYSPNQFFVVLLRGPTYKEYTFHWRLMPRNQNESDTIRHIVTTLNNSAAVGLAFANTMWAFPKIFRLEFYPNSSYLYKFKPAVLQSVQANYAPTGSTAFYKSGAPEAVDLTLVFKEMEYWLTGDFTDANDPNADI